MEHEDPAPPRPHRVDVPLWILVALAAAVALYFGRELFVPIAFAFLLNALFRPVVGWLQRHRVPAPISGGAIVLLLMAAIAGAGYALERPIQAWLSRAPEHFAQAEAKLERFRAPLRKVTAVANRIEKAAQDMGGGPATSQPATAPNGSPTTTAPTPADTTAAQAPPPPPTTPAPPAATSSSPEPVSPRPTALLAGVIGTTSALLGGTVEVLLLLLLLLAGGGALGAKLVSVFPRAQHKAAAQDVVRDANAVVRRYLLVTALINAAQATVVALVLWALHVPSPALWGLFTFVVEFVPYLGATVMVAMLSLVSLATFDGVGHILLVPGSYLAITTIQNNVVSPYAYGRGLKLNPVAILIGVLLWWFLWGVGGAFLAVPILAGAKVLIDRTRTLRALGTFLGE